MQPEPSLARNATKDLIMLAPTSLVLFLLRLLILHQDPVFIARQSRPPRLEALLAWIEPRERMCFCVEDDLIERQEVVGREEEVEVFKGFGLSMIISTSSTSPFPPGTTREECKIKNGKRNTHTNQKLSILSLFGGGSCITSPTLVNPPPFSTIVCLTNASNISQPHSLYTSSPVMRHM